jgi:hypothetical protein
VYVTTWVPSAEERKADVEVLITQS